MWRLTRALRQSGASTSILARQSHPVFIHERRPALPPALLPAHLPALRSSNRFLDLYQLWNKEAIQKERARLADEMNRGYFADMKEFRQHGGKIATANETIFPAISAAKFPNLVVGYSDGGTLTLPVSSDANVVKRESASSAVPKASLICLSFRASSQAMVSSWSKPFLESFSGSKDVQLFEVYFIDSFFLRLGPIKRLYLRRMKKLKDSEEGVLQRHSVFSFGDHYYFRKELKILNLLTGYIFLLDKFGRIRWQGFGMATEEELASLISCTSLLLDEK